MESIGLTGEGGFIGWEGGGAVTSLGESMRLGA